MNTTTEPPAIIITPEQRVRAHAEAKLRLNRYRKLCLGTDTSSGDYSKRTRQFVGVIGEIALRLYLGLPIKFGKGLDGGTDVSYRGQTIQMMTSATPVCNFCYHPDFKPLKADLIVQGAWNEADSSVQLIGVISRKEFDRWSFPRQIGAKLFPSVRIDQMQPVDTLCLPPSET